MNQATIRIIYPSQQGRIVLRTDNDWNADLQPSRIEADGTISVFDVQSPGIALEFKPCVVRDGDFVWAPGTNKLMPLGVGQRDFYPDFFSGTSGTITRPYHAGDSGERSLSFRIYLPPGYHENTLKRYPVLYMHDGRNLFFPGEAFTGQEWRVDETLQLLDAMNIIDQVIVVGVHASDRNRAYTKPGYEGFGKRLVEEIKSWVDETFRTLAGREHTAVMGSSLGGLVSFYLGWQYPEVFGTVACLSSTFWFENDLFERVKTESTDGRRSSRFYLDSGWPGDNYEVTFSMATLLIERGFRLGDNLVHYAFPLAQHNEGAWGARLHLPMQLFAGRLRRL